ncbi:MAG TPA: universal stress protein [Solirubrobacterales bacterium]|nr:universal stress protein [Solirubrobacterales bacterium]
MQTPARVAPAGPLIVGVDESERSRDAIALGRQLALGLPGELMPVYIHTLEELGSLVTGHRSREVEELVAIDAAAEHAKVRALAEEMGISDVQLRQAPSAPAGLHHQAVESNAALVVIGSSSRSGLGRLLPGGTGERLLSGSPVPVAVAPAGYADSQTGCALVGVGFDDSPESQQAVRWAADLAQGSGAALQLIAVHAPLAIGGGVVVGALGTESVNEVLGKELQSQSEKLAKALPSGLSVDSELFRGDPSTVLVERSQGLDLLVLGSRRYGPLKSVLLGSVSSYVIRNAQCPVLVVPRDSTAN